MPFMIWISLLVYEPATGSNVAHPLFQELEADLTNEATMLSSKWFNVVDLSAYTKNFTYPHKKESRSVKSQDHAGKLTDLIREIT